MPTENEADVDGVAMVVLPSRLGRDEQRAWEETLGQTESRPLVVGVLDHGAEGTPSLFDVVVHRASGVASVVPRLVDAPTRLSRAELVDVACRLLGASFLGRGSAATIQAAIEACRDHLDARSVMLFTNDGRRRLVAMDPALGQQGSQALHRLRQRTGLAAGMAAPLVSRLGGDDESEEDASVVTCTAVRSEKDGGGVTLGVELAGAKRISPELQLLLAGAVERLAQETAWQLVQDRLVAELDAVRDVGGLDPLLGVWTRSVLERLLEMMRSAVRRSGSPLSLAVLDVCGMKEINERYGHGEGDGLLKHVAQIVADAVRTADVVARYEGDALAVVFDGAGLEDATRVVERIRNMLHARPYETDAGHGVMIHTAAGITQLEVVDEDEAKAALARAARAASRVDNEMGGIEVTTKVTSGATSGAEITGDSLQGLTLGGGFRILHEIGSGGGGGVYRGEDLALRRPVAIKVLHPDLAGDVEVVERFRQEASILAALRHPNLVQVYTFGVDDNLAYFVMELVEGESLFDTIERCRQEGSRVDTHRAAVILQQIGGALHTLHQSRILHRDVKPGNILLDPFRDRAVLVDVGIASRSDQPDLLAGTPGYMAPEAAAAVKLDPSTDVYGLAATLYELLVLEPPWAPLDDPMAMLQRQLWDPPRRAEERVPELEPLDAIMQRALHRNPHERYRDVRGFVADLGAALASIRAEPSSAHVPASSKERVTTMTSLGLAPTLTFAAGAPQGAPRSESQATRAVVFRTLPRVVGARTSAAWRSELERSAPELAGTLSPTMAPLSWLPTESLVALLARGAPGDERDACSLGHDLGRASLRATFRRFFPVASATLSPSAVLQALPKIWSQYHGWGDVQVGLPRPEFATIDLHRSFGDASICAWTHGMLEQLIALAGGDDVMVDHPTCAATGHDLCTFEARWSWSPSSGESKSWR